MINNHVNVGHEQSQIFNTFMALWPGMAPGGLYFIEDLQVAREEKFRSRGSTVISF